MGRPRMAIGHYTRAVEISRRHTELPGLAATLHNNLGHTYTEMGKLSLARQHLNTSVEIYQKMGAAGRPANALNNLGIVLHLMGETDQARHTLLQALALYEEQDHPNQIDAHINLCDLARNLDDANTAAHHADCALRLAREFNDTRAKAKALIARATIHLAEGQWHRAAHLCGSALEDLDSDDHHHRILTLLTLAEALLGRGDHEEARAHCGNALALIDASSFTRFEADTHAVLARSLMATGDMEQALHHAKTALTLHETTGYTFGIAHTRVLVRQLEDCADKGGDQ